MLSIEATLPENGAGLFDHVVGSERIAVMEFYVGTQLDAPGEWIDIGPRQGKRRFQLRVRVGIHQPIEDLHGHVLVVSGSRELRIDGGRFCGATDDEVGSMHGAEGQHSCCKCRDEKFQRLHSSSPINAWSHGASLRDARQTSASGRDCRQIMVLDLADGIGWIATGTASASRPSAASAGISKFSNMMPPFPHRLEE
jgi:hypothetical protein